MVAPLRHRQTKEAETDMFDLQPPRHIWTLHKSVGGQGVDLRQLLGEQRKYMDRRPRLPPRLMTHNGRRPDRNPALHKS